MLKAKRLKIYIFFRRKHSQKSLIQESIDKASHLVFNQLCNLFYSFAQSYAQHLTFFTEYQNYSTPVFLP